MRLRRLTKSVLIFESGAEEFMKGLSSNTTQASKNSFLDAQGRIVATFDQIRSADGAVFAIMESNFVARTTDHLQKYLALSGVKMELRPNLNVYFDLDGDATLPPDALIVERGAGRIAVTAATLAPNVSDEEFTRYRVRHRIPVQGIDYDREMLLDLDDLSYVSFTKGCFLGQEIIARVHHRGRPPKKLISVRLSDLPPSQALLATSRVTDDAGVEVGFVFAKNP